MKKLLVLFTLLLALSLPVLAQEPVPPADQPWSHAAQEIMFAGTFTRDAATNHLDGRFAAYWATYVTDQTEIGAAMGYQGDASGVSGESAGLFYRYNFPRLKKGNFFMGGTAAAYTGDLRTLANASAMLEGGYRLYIGKHAAAFASVQQTQAFGSVSPEGDLLNQTSLMFGFSTGFTPATPIQ